jgi:hypothetical protein
MRLRRPFLLGSVRSATFFSIASIAAFTALSPRAAHAQPPPPELMARLATYGEALEKMRTHASYLLDGHLDGLDGDGKVDSMKTLKGRVEADGHHTHFVVIKYVEDGEDKTDEARQKAHKNDARSQKEKDDDKLEFPFQASAQAHYVFDQVGVDTVDPSRVRISFVPKAPDEHQTEGSAWVDTKSGTVLSAGFKLAKPGFFVDYVKLTLEFAAMTELGPLISKVTIDGKGGILFFRKRFHGEATLTDYRITP